MAGSSVSGSIRTSVRALAGLAALWIASACSPPSVGCPAPVSGEITLGPEWTVITPPQPLVSEQSIQELHLVFPDSHRIGSALNSDASTGTVELTGSRRVVFEAVLHDSAGGEWELRPSGFDSGLYLSRKDIPQQGPFFPPDRQYPSVRMRTSERVPVSSITWECRTNI